MLYTPSTLLIRFQSVKDLKATNSTEPRHPNYMRELTAPGKEKVKIIKDFTEITDPPYHELEATGRCDIVLQETAPKHLSGAHVSSRHVIHTRAHVIAIERLE